MARSEVLLLIGNGLSMDLRQQFAKELSDWHTSYPLSWGLRHPELGAPLRDLFPAAFNALDRFSGDDFERMMQLLDEEKSQKVRPVVELRHYLVMAFSMYQRAVDRLPLQKWHWWPFFRDNRASISGIVSFNYDLVAERMATRAKINLVTPAVSKSTKASSSYLRRDVPILWKPHGSIDYRPDKSSIVMEATYPLTNLVYDNNLELEWCPPNEWTKPRIQADVVVPTEASRYRNFQWVTPGERRVKAIGSRWSTCVIVGLSYAPCDREEIDIVLASLPKDAQMVVVDPNPSPALIQRLQQLGLTVTCMQGPPDLGAA